MTGRRIGLRPADEDKENQFNLPRESMIIRIAVLAAAFFLVQCTAGNDTPAEEPIGIKEEFSDTPGLVRTEIVDAAGRLTTIGYYLNGKKEGAWTDYTQDERVHRLTTYVNGKKEGIYLEFSTANQVTVRCFYHNDVRHGRYVEYSTLGLKEERYYVNGKIDGLVRVYFNDGKLMEEGYYKEGQREGISKWYDREGNKTLEYEYRKGELVKK
jgi:antitoxin component YwqK of YwqJK toxin-antitoxin module